MIIVQLYKYLAWPGPPIPVYRIPGYRRKYGQYWYRYCTMWYCRFRYWQFSQSAVFDTQSLVICLGPVCSE